MSIPNKRAIAYTWPATGYPAVYHARIDDPTVLTRCTANAGDLS